MADIPQTPLLDTVHTPDDLRRLAPEQLRQLADELRTETISAVGTTGGHLGSGLGVVELTVALHYVFNTPDDRLIWDVGHQCYPHKILTGRRERIRTIRQGGGLSGFTKRSESEYDPFGAAHSSTSISAALGFAIANKLAGTPGKGIAVIGDGAMSAGMAYEAMNNAEQAGNRLVVILNDNDMSIAPPVGGLSAYLSRMVSSREFLGVRDVLKKLAKRFPRPIQKAAQKTDEFARGMTMGGTLFEELGFYYVGPIDGHNLDHLIPVLENVRDAEQGPILIHVVTKKGKGYAPAEAAADKYHGVQKFDVITGAQAKAPRDRPPIRMSSVRRWPRKPTAIRASAPSPPPCPRAPVWTGSRMRIRSASSTSASPSSTPSPLPPVWRRRGCGPSAPSIPPSSSAPMTRWSMTSRSRTCRSASRSTAPVWSGRTGRPMRARSTSPIWPACPTWS
ncbi:hypothetical protein GCM10020258_35250 [Sphingomonas yabuuchiae]